MATARSIGIAVTSALAFTVAAAIPAASDTTIAEQADLRGLLGNPSRLSIRHVSLRTALNELTRASGVPLAYSPSMLPKLTDISCSCGALSVGDALGIILSGTAFDFREGDGEVILAPRPSTSFRGAAYR